MIFWRLQQSLAVLIGLAFAGRMKNACIDQIHKNGVQIILEVITVGNRTTDFIHAELSDKALEEQITRVKKTLFIQDNVYTL